MKKKGKEKEAKKDGLMVSAVNATSGHLTTSLSLILMYLLRQPQMTLLSFTLGMKEDGCLIPDAQIISYMIFLFC